MPARLRITGGRNVDHIYKIKDDGAATLGRSPRADVRVPDGNASRKHCRIEQAGGRWTITDLKSMNGTHVNEKSVTEAPLKPGDEIRIADTTFEFTIDGEEAPDSAEQRAEEPAAADPSDGEACVCAQCGRDLPPNAIDAGSATEIGGRLFCSRCVVRHPDAEEEPAGPAEAPKPLSDTGESSEFGSLLKSLERATEADRLGASEAASPPPEPEPPKSRGGLLDRLRGRKSEE